MKSTIRVAYFLLAHKSPEQINAFIRQLLAYGDCDIYIHVDKKQEWILDHIDKSDNVTAISKYDVKWGGVEIPKSALELMRLARDSGKQYSHMYFGSCQDLLVKKGLYDYLDQHNTDVFLTIRGKVTDKDRQSACYRVKWPKALLVRGDWHPYRFVRIGIQLLASIGIVVRPNRVKLQTSIEFYDGETWFICPYEVMSYILDYVESNPDYLLFWEDSLASDLMFFQSIIMNSQFRASVKNGLMFVRFGNTFGTKNHPRLITKEDSSLIESGNFFCARKVDAKDSETIDYYIQKSLN